MTNFGELVLQRLLAVYSLLSLVKSASRSICTNVANSGTNACSVFVLSRIQNVLLSRKKNIFQEFRRSMNSLPSWEVCHAHFSSD